MNLRRTIELMAAIMGFLLLTPVLGMAAFLIKICDNGPIFFRQERIGEGGKSFKILKFRTMVVGSEKQGRSITVGNDPRITRFGYWMRKYKIDELPQLINVIFGEMSIVGPRPEVPKYIALYTKEQARVLTIRPGITDPASIKYRKESEILIRSNDPEKLYIEEIMPDKIRINLEYADKATFSSDLAIVIKTICILKD